jgi:hypothetical protein
VWLVYVYNGTYVAKDDGCLKRNKN